VPPELTALEQKMAQIRFNSEHYRVTVEALTSPSALGGMASVSEVAPREGAFLGAIIAGQGVSSVAPPAGEFSIREGRKVLAQVRMTGGKLYKFDPSVYSYDGHRPWVATTLRGSSLFGSSGLADGALPGSAGNFLPLIALIEKAQKIEPLGPSIVDGVPVSGFGATLSVASLVTGPTASKQLAALNKVGITSALLEVFVSSGGLPIRVRTSFTGPSVQEAVVTDIVALEVPVAIQAPPARKTISKAALRRIQQHHRFCIKVPAPNSKKQRRICVTPGGSPENEGEESPFGVTG
jgi:hypothetical protein